MKIKNLENCFKSAKVQGVKFLGVKIWMDGFEKEEIIINPIENFDKKLEYYKNSYSENLVLKNAPDKIKIVGFTFGNSFEEIEKDLTETIELMNSKEYKERFKAEYLQLLIRTQNLEKALLKMTKGELDFKSKCSYSLLLKQYNVMVDYGCLLEQRAAVEGIQLI